MAGQADGTVVIDTDLDPEGFKAGSDRLKKAISSLSTSAQELGPTFQKALTGNGSAITSFTGKAEALEQKISDIESQMEAFGKKTVRTEEYKALTAELGEATAELERLTYQQADMIASGQNRVNVQEYKLLGRDIEFCTKKIQELKAEKEELERSGKAVKLSSETDQYQQLAQELSAAREELSEMQSRVANVRDNMNSTANYAGAVSSHLGTAAKNASGKLVYGIRQAASHMWSIVTHGKSANKQFAGLISGAKKFALRLLGARGVYALLRKAVNAYMEENQRLSSTLSSCWSGIGNILGPIITRVINLVATAVAYVTQFLSLFGIFGKKATSSIKAAGGAAGSEAKKLEKQLASFDELNILQNNDSGGGGGGGAGGAEAPAADVELPDWAKLMVEQMKAGAWGDAGKTLANALNDMVDNIDWAGWGSRLGKGIQNGISFALNFARTFDWQGLGSDIATFLNNVIDNIDPNDLGALLAQKIRIAVEFAYGFVTTFDWSGNGQWLGEVVNGWFDEIDWEKTGKTVGGAIHGAITFGIEFLKTVDWGEAVQALLDVVKGIFEELTVEDWTVISAIIGIKLLPKILKKAFSGITFKDNVADVGDASASAGELSETVKGGLNPKLSSLAKNLGMGIVIIGEVAIAAGIIVGSIWGLGVLLQKVGEAWQPVLENGQTVITAMLLGTGILAGVGLVTAALGKAGGKLAADIGIGAAILLEISVAADLFLGEIWVIGKLLDEIGKAWQPVLDNKDTVVTAIETGSGILVAVGAVCGALGAITLATGGTIAAAIAVGAGVLAEISLAADGFLVEVKVIGDLLKDIYDAWEPVLPLKEPIIRALEMATELLTSVGLITGGLGAITILSFGTIALAIASGAGVMLEISAALKSFIDEMISVSKKLKDDLAPALEDLNPVLPDLNSNLSDFVDFMEEFAGHVVRYTKANGISALSGAIDTIIGWFTKDPIQKLADDVKKTYDQTKTLHDNLTLAVPELKAASELLADYQKYIDEIARLTNTDNTPLGSSMLVNMQEVGKNLVIGFADGMDSESGRLERSFTSMEKLAETMKKNILSTLDKLVKDAKTKFDQMKTNAANSWKAISDDAAKKWDSIRQTVSNKLTGKGGLAETVAAGLNSAKSKASAGASGIASAITGALSYFPAYTWGAHVAQNMAEGIDGNAWRVRSSANNLAEIIRKYLHFSEPDVGPLSDFHTYGPDLVRELAQGMDENRNLAASSAAGIASAISGELQKGEYAIQSISPIAETDRALSSFADRVSSSFTNLLDRLQAIADGVTFRVPAAANGLVPYRTAAAAAGSGPDVSSVIEAGNEELIGVLNQLALTIINAVVPAIDRNGNPVVNIGDSEIGRAAIREINRTTRRDGKSPLF